MGACTCCSTAAEQKLSNHDNCDCVLYDHYDHCCKNQCLLMDLEELKQIRVEQLTELFFLYNAEQLVSIVTEYLADPIDYDIIRINSLEDKKYHVYAHKVFGKLYNYKNNTQPCQYWTDYFAYISGHFKAILDGSEKSGKSCLARRVMLDQWFPDFSHLRGGGYESHQVTNSIITGYGKRVTWTLRDGDKNKWGHDDKWLESSRKNANLFILCFAMNDKKSFTEVVFYRNRILRLKDEREKEKDNPLPWAMILVATKCDLTNEIEVKRDDAIQLSKQWNIPYIETSAKLVKNIDCLKHMFLFELWRAYTIMGNKHKKPPTCASYNRIEGLCE